MHINDQLLAAELDIELSTKLDKDLKAAASTLRPHEVRFLVDTYYQYQNNRIRAANQVRALTTEGEPHAVLDWLNVQSRALEASIKGALQIYAESQPLGRWAMSIVGVGPVIASGLLGHIDFDRAPTAGHIFSFAGIHPEVKWNKGEKRPFNAELKTLTFKIGDCFIKFKNHKNDTYGKLYQQRKDEEHAKNQAGLYASEAERALREKNYSKDTVSKKAYEQGKLPDGHIHARARRWTVKLFLSHYHTVGYYLKFGRIPAAPYTIAHLGHVHYIAPPNVESVPGLSDALAVAGLVGKIID